MGEAAALEKDGVERDLQERWPRAGRAAARASGSCAASGRPTSARSTSCAATRRRLDRGRDQARRHDRRRRAARRATSSASATTRRWPDCRGVLAAQAVKPQARVLAEARGIAWVEVDLAVLRGEREPELTLFGA
jgi:hypothetical protein